MSDLKPCPFCGATDSVDNAVQEAGVHIWEFRGAHGGPATRVECRCGVNGRASAHKDHATRYNEAVAAWNSRVSPAKEGSRQP